MQLFGVRWGGTAPILGVPGLLGTTCCRRLAADTVYEESRETLVTRSPGTLEAVWGGGWGQTHAWREDLGPCAPFLICIVGGAGYCKSPLSPPLSLLLLQPVFPDGPGATLPPVVSVGQELGVQLGWVALAQGLP